MLRLALYLICILMFAAPAARAGEAACWFENGVVVVTAQVMGVTGDYILDTATPRTQLAKSQAQTAGFADIVLTGEIWLAGVHIAARPVLVADLDVRTGGLPTPIAGVIGADVLRQYVLDVSFAPCRIGLALPGGARRRPRTAVVPLTWIAGRPSIAVAVSDGPRALSGAFAAGTGIDAAVRLSDAIAAVPSSIKPRELYPYGVQRPRLRALAFANRIVENVPGGLIMAEDPELIGAIGAPLLSRYRLRFDFPTGRLLLAAPSREAAALDGETQLKAKKAPAFARALVP